MKLADRLNCPSCKGRLTAALDGGLRCSGCDRIIPISEGVADFTGDAPVVNAGRLPGRNSDRRFAGFDPNADAAGLLDRMQTAAADRWPEFLGDVIAFGRAGNETAVAAAASRKLRSLLLLDRDPASLQACRTRIGTDGCAFDRPAGYARFNEKQDAIRDAVADTVLGGGLLAEITDIRAFLTMVHRVLKPNGRAAFVVPNRRFHGAMCSAMAEALVLCHARDGIWPDGEAAVLEFLAQMRRRLLHQGDAQFLAGLEEKHLFDSDETTDLGQEVGFAHVAMLPLQPDPAGAETTRRFCRQAGTNDDFSESFGLLVAAVGQPYFSLLGRQDASASMLLWLTKGAGPSVRIFTQRPPSSADIMGPEPAVSGLSPRWSIELLAQDTSDGVLVSVGGWCLCNTDIQWVRLTLDGIVRCAPVWRPRPDVHEVLNRNGRYHALKALCSGLSNDLLFDDVHPVDNACAIQIDILLASGATVSGPSSGMLVMDQSIVIAH